MYNTRCRTTPLIVHGIDKLLDKSKRQIIHKLVLFMSMISLQERTA